MHRRFLWPPGEAIGGDSGVGGAGSGGAEMSSDVIMGHDGKPRCAWAGAGDTVLGRYHDEV